MHSIPNIYTISNTCAKLTKKNAQVSGAEQIAHITAGNNIS